ncbi:hypothetical protein KWH86_23120, partial [Enterobacter cloacae]
MAGAAGALGARPASGAARKGQDLTTPRAGAGPLLLLFPISTSPATADAEFPMAAFGSQKISPLRRGLAIDSTVDIFTFYVPHRHVYGEHWIKFMKDGVNATPLPTVN